jgi:hypothetical protein
MKKNFKDSGVCRMFDARKIPLNIEWNRFFSEYKNSYLKNPRLKKYSSVRINNFSKSSGSDAHRVYVSISIPRTHENLFIKLVLINQFIFSII